MNTASLAATEHIGQDGRPQLDQKPGFATIALFFLLLAVGLGYTAYSLTQDVTETGVRTTTFLPSGNAAKTPA